MRKLVLICTLLCSTCIESYAQNNSSIVLLDSAVLSEKKLLGEDSVSNSLMPRLTTPLENTRDSIFSRETFGRRAWKAGKIIIVGELSAMAFFAAMPEDFSNWNKNFYRNAPTHWKNAFTMPPKLDDDPLIVNYIQHPLAGAIYYNGLRAQGASPLHSFLFSCAESTFFEYFIESVAERPSIQDLIVTPIAGSLIGELQNQATILMSRNGFNFAEKIAVFIVNPMYVVFNGYKTKGHVHIHY